MKQLIYILGLMALTLSSFAGDGTPVAAASQAEVNAGVVKNKYVSPATLNGSAGGTNDATLTGTNNFTGPNSDLAYNTYDLKGYFGLKIDGKIINNCMMISNSVVLTNLDGTANWISSDTGKVCAVFEAGGTQIVPYGDWPSTNAIALSAIITNVINSTSVQLSLPAQLSVTNVSVLYGTDDGLALSNAIYSVCTNPTNLLAGGAKLRGNGTVIVNIQKFQPGPDVFEQRIGGFTNGLHNSQLFIPHIPQMGTHPFRLIFEGPWAPKTQQPSAPQNISANGFVIWSTLMSTNGGKVLDFADYTAPFFGAGCLADIWVNDILPTFRNITFRTLPGTTLTAIDARSAVAVDVDGLMIDKGYDFNNAHDNTGIYTTFHPVYSNECAIRFPPSNSGEETTIGSLDCFGYYNTMTAGEHMTWNHTTLIGDSVNPVVFDTGGHWDVPILLDASICRNTFVMAGPTNDWGNGCQFNFKAYVTLENGGLLTTNGAQLVFDPYNKFGGHVVYESYVAPATNVGGANLRITSFRRISGNAVPPIEQNNFKIYSSGSSSGLILDSDVNQVSTGTRKIWNIYLAPTNSGVGTYFSIRSVNANGTAGQDVLFFETNGVAEFPNGIDGGNPFGSSPLSMINGATSKNIVVTNSSSITGVGFTNGAISASTNISISAFGNTWNFTATASNLIVGLDGTATNGFVISTNGHVGIGIDPTTDTSQGSLFKLFVGAAASGPAYFAGANNTIFNGGWYSLADCRFGNGSGISGNGTSLKLKGNLSNPKQVQLFASSSSIPDLDVTNGTVIANVAFVANSTISGNGSGITNIFATNLVGNITITNPVTLGTPWTNTYGYLGTLAINYSLTDSAISGDPSLNITNTSSGDYLNATNAFALSGVSKGRCIFRVGTNEVITTANLSSGSASAAIDSSYFRP